MASDPGFRKFLAEVRIDIVSRGYRIQKTKKAKRWNAGFSVIGVSEYERTKRANRHDGTIRCSHAGTVGGFLCVRTAWANARPSLHW